MPVGWRSRVPEKITSSMRDPRSVFADCSPSTQEIASAMFDLPHPFGPMMAATPSPGNFSSVRSQKDLKPRTCSLFSLSNSHSFGIPSRGTACVLEHPHCVRWLERAARFAGREEDRYYLDASPSSLGLVPPCCGQGSAQVAAN